MKHDNYQTLLTATLILIILTSYSYAADPGHAAERIASGTFESGNYTFPDSVNISRGLEVAKGTLYVHPNNSLVGIGTTSPGRTLDVNGLVRSRSSFETTETDGTRNGLMTTYKAVTGSGTDRSTVIFAESVAGQSTAVHIMTNGSATSRFMVDDSGNVGIGTTAPSYLLETARSTIGANLSGVLYVNGTSGNVGINTTNPKVKLEVAGSINATNGGRIEGIGSVPSGMIAFFAGSACPSGWTEYTAARGRAIVGLVASGTAAGTVGTALTDKQDKTHTHTGPSHTHTYSTVIAHTHSVDPPSTTSSSGGSHSHGITDSGHTHSIMASRSSASGSETGDGFALGNYITSGASTTGIIINADGSHTHTTDITSFTSDSTGSASGTTAADGTGATGTAATSNVIPYIQLIACQAP